MPYDLKSKDPTRDGGENDLFGPFHNAYLTPCPSNNVTFAAWYPFLFWSPLGPGLVASPVTRSGFLNCPWDALMPSLHLANSLFLAVNGP